MKKRANFLLSIISISITMVIVTTNSSHAGLFSRKKKKEVPRETTNKVINPLIEELSPIDAKMKEISKLSVSEKQDSIAKLVATELGNPSGTLVQFLLETSHGDTKIDEKRRMNFISVCTLSTALKYLKLLAPYIIERNELQQIQSDFKHSLSEMDELAKMVKDSSNIFNLNSKYIFTQYGLYSILVFNRDLVWKRSQLKKSLGDNTIEMIEKMEKEVPNPRPVEIEQIISTIGSYIGEENIPYIREYIFTVREIQKSQKKMMDLITEYSKASIQEGKKTATKANL